MSGNMEVGHEIGVSEWSDTLSSLSDDQGLCGHLIPHLYLRSPWSIFFSVYGSTRPSAPRL